MAVSILFIIEFVLFVVGAVLLPKCESRINGIKAAVMAIMAAFCYQALLAFVYARIGIRVDIKSTAVSMALADVLLWGGILWKRRVQKLFFRFSDMLCILVLTAAVVGVSLHMFTPELRLSYINTDPANHFKFAMNVVKSGDVAGIYFSAFIDAMFIELFAPILAEISYYKAFILADIFMHILEVWMFYVLVLTISEKKAVRIAAPFLTLLYFWGYPAYSYMTGGFVYWSNGVMILIFMVYALLLLEKHNTMSWQPAVLLVLGAYANSCCNKLFIPVNYLAFFVALFVILWRQKKQVLNKQVLFATLGIVAVVCVTAVVLFWNSWDGSLQKMIEYVSVAGGIYRSMYADMIFFVPVLLFVCYYSLYRREYSGTLPLMAACMLICAAGMYLFWYNALMSTYYYYKIYYNLWLFGWILAAAALDLAVEKKQMTGLLSYAGMLLLMGIISWTNYDDVMKASAEDYNAYYATEELFPLYRFNADSLLADYEKYKLSPMALDVYAYVLEYMPDEEFIPMISSIGEYRYWFDGMRVQDSDGVRADRLSLEEIVTQLDAWGINKIAVIKFDTFYIENSSYFQQCVPLYENADAAVYTFSGANWKEGYEKVKAAEEAAAGQE